MLHIVLRFAAGMAQKLEENSHKHGWETMSLLQHLQRLKQEVGELERAIREKKPADKIRREAYDVGNFAAFICEVSYNQFERDL